MIRAHLKSYSKVRTILKRLLCCIKTKISPVCIMASLQAEPCGLHHRFCVDDQAPLLECPAAVTVPTEPSKHVAVVTLPTSEVKVKENDGLPFVVRAFLVDQTRLGTGDEQLVPLRDASGARPPQPPLPPAARPASTSSHPTVHRPPLPPPRHASPLPQCVPRSRSRSPGCGHFMCCAGAYYTYQLFENEQNNR